MLVAQCAKDMYLLYFAHNRLYQSPEEKLAALEAQIQKLTNHSNFAKHPKVEVLEERLFQIKRVVLESDHRVKTECKPKKEPRSDG